MRLGLVERLDSDPLFTGQCPRCERAIHAIAADIAARTEAIDQAMAAIEHLKSLTKQSHSISDELELIGRYEARNARMLKAAIEQLQQLQVVWQQQADGITLNGKEPRLRAV
jgi:hypothetical protein